jgi:hypothetical protein
MRDDPATARFLSPDSVPPSAGDPLSLNAYAYCQGDPVNKWDPSGAIVDWDGNGKSDSWDNQMAMAAKAKNPARKAKWQAKATASHGRAQDRAARQGVAKAREPWTDHWYTDTNLAPQGRTFGIINNKVSPGRSRLESRNVDRRVYAGLSVGAPAFGGAAYMNGEGTTVPGIYLEFVGGAAYGVAGGWYYTMDELFDHDFDWPPHAYSQQGIASPQAGASVFVVLPWDLGW